MSAVRHVSLDDLLRVMPQVEIERIIARRGRVNAAVFLEVLHSDLDDAIGRLEAAAHHYASDGAEKLTHFLAVQLASVGYNARCEADEHHTGLKVENHAAKVVWMAAANLYSSCAQNIANLLQLFARTSGRHAHAGFLLYIRERGAAHIIESWVKTLQADQRAACHTVTIGEAACVFISDHAHPSSKFPIAIRHHAVLMERAGRLEVESDHPGALPEGERSLTRPMKKHIILFLAANPSGTDRLALDREAREIHVELERSGARDCFEFVTRWAVAPLDLLHELRKLKPTVVHFSGLGGQHVAAEHRSGEAPDRDVASDLALPSGEPQGGMFFQGPDGGPQFVTTAALQETFGAADAPVKLVILNACYSEPQAEALLAHVDCVVGMGGAIRDDAARSFAIGFYGGLGERASVVAAYRQGRAAISLEGLHDGEPPQLKVRAGVDADRLVLAAEPR
jgi:hypothetical protein